VPGYGDVIRWGILGCGRIAEIFATGLKDVPDAKLVAVGSREQSTADAFADRLGADRRHASYEALANDPEVDVIYVATPHMVHKAATLRCLGAGKPVLCEKPFAINASEAEEMIACARTKGLFLMEAMWTRFTPLMGQVREILENGDIGDVRMLSADLGFRAALGRPARLFDLAYGGGALMDVGVYVTSFSSMVLGKPTRIVSMPTMGDAGVDEQAAFIFGHENGALSVLSTAIRTTTPHVATIMGSDGLIEIHYDWHKPVAATLKIASKEDERIEPEKIGNGYNYEAIEVNRCLREGLLESPIMPLDETHSIMQTLDEIRAQWGLRFPME
jgi:predicted dehydrogenase